MTNKYTLLTGQYLTIIYIKYSLKNFVDLSYNRHYVQYKIHWVKILLNISLFIYILNYGRPIVEFIWMFISSLFRIILNSELPYIFLKPFLNLTLYILSIRLQDGICK
jgi:hypothetical protein